MSLMDDAIVQAYRIRPALTMDGRDQSRDYGAAATRTLAYVIAQPLTGREDQQVERDATLDQWSIMDQDSGAGFWQKTDRVELGGVQYQIEGGVQEWPEPLPHTYFIINHWEG